MEDFGDPTLVRRCVDGLPAGELPEVLTQVRGASIFLVRCQHNSDAMADTDRSTAIHNVVPARHEEMLTELGTAHPVFPFKFNGPMPCATSIRIKQDAIDVESKREHRNNLCVRRNRSAGPRRLIIRHSPRPHEWRTRRTPEP